MKKLLLITILGLSSCAVVETTDVGSRAEGESCRRVSDCLAGLDCVESSSGMTCSRIDMTQQAPSGGQSCTMDSECEENYCCGNGGICRTQRPEFETTCGNAECSLCGLSYDCAPGLVCSGFGQCLDPNPGQLETCNRTDDCSTCGTLCLDGVCKTVGVADVGEACAETAECRRPLLCHPILQACEAPPFFAGTSCQRSESEGGAFRPYFVVPRQSGPIIAGQGTPEEFYQLPFPSDIRLSMGKPNMAGHYAPDADALGFDIGSLYFDAIQEDLDGYGVSQPVFFRYTDPIDRGTASSTAAEPTVIMVNIDADSPNYKKRIPTRISYSTQKGQFICANALGVAPVDGFALDPGTLYAVILTKGITSKWGSTPILDLDFISMLEDSEPEDSVLADAHAVFEPLRQFLKEDQLDQEQVAVATVYRTGNPGKLAPKIREAVRRADSPQIVEWTVCGSGDTISCNATNDPFVNPRDCSGSTKFVEIHAKIRHPILQKGSRPYRLPPEGTIELDNTGNPIIQGYEELCVSLTIPNDRPKPANGWPVVIYGHGTGGNFTTVARTGTISDRLSRNGIAAIGFDGMMHGPRQSTTSTSPSNWKDPGLIFFNALNPRASQANVMQGGADIFNLVRFAETANMSSGNIPGLRENVSFNSDQIMYYGHSQGTVIAPPAIAHEPNLKAVVLTGAGAEIGLTVVHKRKPNDLTGTIKGVLGDQSISRLHPMIGVLSWYFGDTDAVAFGQYFAKNREKLGRPVNYLHVFGVDDFFTPDVTQKALIRAGGYPIFGDVLSPIDGYKSDLTATQGNVEVNGIKATVGALQYVNPTPNSDGHFTGTQNPAAVNAVQRFLKSAIEETNGAIIQR
ncbi:MAG: hypothetical protein VYC39_19240 [Myxococcota bacterium]|nr:hypothetical protein [Myxococcota bacterium]